MLDYYRSIKDENQRISASGSSSGLAWPESARRAPSPGRNPQAPRCGTSTPGIRPLAWWPLRVQIVYVYYMLNIRINFTYIIYQTYISSKFNYIK